MLLVITNKADLASDYLILRLKERNIPFQRLNTEDLGKRFQVDISLDNQESSFQITFFDGRRAKPSDITAVFFRQPLPPDFTTNVAESDHEFANREAKELLRSLWRLIHREKWLNHPRDLWLASNKIEQLTIAQSLGFRIPATCVSASERTVRRFFETHNGHVICKAVKHGFQRHKNVVSVATTQRLTSEFLERFREYAPVPMTYQEEVLKAFDVRVTVVGESVFAAAIHSQEHPETAVDWRLWDVHDFDLKHEPIKLPEGVEQMCREVTRHFNLKYSAIDLIKARDGQYYFLELNPNGQWAWIEQKAGYPIRDALIHCLGFQNAPAYA